MFLSMRLKGRRPIVLLFLFLAFLNVDLNAENLINKKLKIRQKEDERPESLLDQSKIREECLLEENLDSGVDQALQSGQEDDVQAVDSSNDQANNESNQNLNKNRNNNQDQEITKKQKDVRSAFKIDNQPKKEDLKNNKDQDSELKDNKEKDKKKEEDAEKEKREKEEKERGYKKREPMLWALGGHEIRNWIKLRLPDFFYGKNLRLLNNDNPTDRVVVFKHALDLNTEYRFINHIKNYDILFAKMNIRNKGVWGDPESIAFTTPSEIKILDSVLGTHSHAIPRHIMWIRELWMQFDFRDFFFIPLCNQHTITFGAFPFELGRGISLGASFKVDPTDLGYYAEVAVDQYAFGAKISGEIYKDRFYYDLYVSILDDKATSFALTSENIRGQQYGHRNDQARGFGIINYIIAGRFKITPIEYKNVNIYFEPYALYNHNPEQKIEFLGDAVNDLITIGIAGESHVGNWEWGFDTAFNLGEQTVFGWDRNFIKLENRNGTIVEINTQVRQSPPGEIPDARKSPFALNVPENQKIIDVSEQSSTENGKIIGFNSLGTLINTPRRFRDPYINKLRGSMLVFDMGYNIRACNLKACLAFGFASGDKDPNRDLSFLGDSQVDGDYTGFISLEETYAGTRVKSAFLLSGAGKVPRLLSFPSEETDNPFPLQVSRFTNLIFTGASLKWVPAWSTHHWNIYPNILAFWQEDPSRFFNKKILADISKKREAKRLRDLKNQDENAKNLRHNNLEKFLDQANQFLGIELNVFAEAEVIEGLRLFYVGALFLPGKHYKDISGRPITRAQQKFLDNLDRTGIVNNRVPLLGHDVAYYANLGLEYKF